MKNILSTVIGMTLFAGCCIAVAGDEFRESGDKLGYSIGYQIGSDFRSQGVSISPDIVLKGVEDALSGAEPLMKPTEMDTTLAELQRRVRAEE